MPEKPADPADTPDVAHRLSVAITRLRMRLREEAGLYGTGLSISQIMVLKQIVTEGPVTAAYLASAQHVSPQSIAQNLAVLKAAGLVHTGRDPDDGRKTLIRADPSGASLVTTITASRKSFLVQAIDTLVAPEERTALAKAIELLERFAAADLSGSGTEAPGTPGAPAAPEAPGTHGSPENATPATPDAAE